MKQLLMIAFAALLLALPGIARADDALVKLMQEIDTLSTTQLQMADKFKDNVAEAKADKARYDQLNKEDLREKKEHITLEQQRKEVKQACVGIIPAGTLIEATNSCNAINGPFQQNIAIHNEAIAKTAKDYSALNAKEKNRADEAAKLQAEDADQKAQLYSLKRKVLIGIKNACIPACSEQSPNRVNGCILGCWERARLKRQLPRLPGEKAEPAPAPDIPDAAAETPPPPVAPPPKADPGDPLAGAPRQPQ